MKKKSTVNLCFVLDDGYSLPTCVAIASALYSKNPETNYAVYLLCNQVTQENRDKFLELNRKDFLIKFVDVDTKEDYSYLKIDTISATPTSICKFFIPEILKTLDKVIYLDGDVIVTKDLTELFEIDLQDNYVAAVKDLCGIDHSDYKKDDFRYFNSGIMLMNLRKMRYDGMPRKLLDYRLNGYNDMMDQDALNYVLKEHTVIIPLKYNTQINLLSQIGQTKSKVFNLQATKAYYGLSSDCDAEKILSDAVVIHYATSKPWKYYDLYGNMIWEKVFNMSPYKNTQLSRKSLLAESTTFRVGQKILSPFVKIKSLRTALRYRRRYQFFGQFIKTADGWKCNESELPKCRNYRGEK